MLTGICLFICIVSQLAEFCNLYHLSVYGLCLDYGFRGLTWTTLGKLRFLNPGRTR